MMTDGNLLSIEYYFKASGNNDPEISAKFFNSKGYYFGIIYNYDRKEIKLFLKFPNHYESMTKLEKREFTSSLEREFNISISRIIVVSLRSENYLNNLLKLTYTMK